MGSVLSLARSSGFDGWPVSVRAVAQHYGTTSVQAAFETFLHAHATNPSITVHTERHQLGGWIYVSGEGFTPNTNVHLQAEGILHHIGPYGLGITPIGDDGTFSDYVFDARCEPEQQDNVTVRAVDGATGGSATGETSAFSCG